MREYYCRAYWTWDTIGPYDVPKIIRLPKDPVDALNELNNIFKMAGIGDIEDNLDKFELYLVVRASGEGENHNHLKHKQMEQEEHQLRLPAPGMSPGEWLNRCRLDYPVLDWDKWLRDI